mmetsp:Transcript_33650/g.95176  ORF Transcript_33650/g.95176 Transcript_33650/m.95176 type:complete len:217 (+) Transcript_33650:2326-2976(+)
MQGLGELLLHVKVVQSIVHGAAHEKLHRHVVHPLWVLLLEVLLRVVPGLDETVPQAVRTGLVGLKVVKLVAAAGEGVLHMVYDALLNAQHIVADVGVHESVEQVLLGVDGDSGEVGALALRLRAKGGEDGGEAGLEVRHLLRRVHLAARSGGDVEDIADGAGLRLGVNVGLHYVHVEVTEGVGNGLQEARLVGGDQRHARVLRVAVVVHLDRHARR